MTKFLKLNSNSSGVGPQGLQGSQGYQGSQGLQGIQGDSGIQGLQGYPGIQGLQGHIGIQGLSGAQGLQGLQGAQGLQGLLGTQGLQGALGAQGQSGSVALSSNFISTYQTCSSTTYIDLASPATSVTLTTGSSVIVLLYATINLTTTSITAYLNFKVSGATELSPADSRGCSSATVGYNTIGTAFNLTALNPGTNTFTLQYRVSTLSAMFGNRQLIVIPQ